MQVPFSPPDITEKEIAEVVDALRSGWITTGPKTKAFERALTAYCGTDCTVCLNSATAAMEMGLRALGVGPGDEVITSAYTYTASAAVIHHVGAKIVLADTLPGSFFIDPEGVKKALTSRTKVVIPVDLGGVMADHDAIIAVLEEMKHLYTPETDLQRAFDRVVVLADAAHSIGAVSHGRRSGAAADFTAFSFHAVKNLTTAEGGALTWKKRAGMDSEALYRQLQLLSLHGQNKDALAKMKLGAWEYDIAFPGYKCNMTDLMAGIGLAQLERFEEITQKRGAVVKAYDEAFLPLGMTSLNHFDSGRLGNFHLYLLRLTGYDEARRNAFIAAMAEQGIACNVHFKPLPLFTAYRNLGFDIADFPHAYAQYQNEVTLPSHSLLSEEQVAHVIREAVALIKRG